LGVTGPYRISYRIGLQHALLSSVILITTVIQALQCYHFKPSFPFLPVLRPQYRYWVNSTILPIMSAALRISNKRKAARVSTLADSARTSGSSSPKSGARKPKSRRRSSEEAPSITTNFAEASEDQVATPEAADGPARRLDPTLAAVGDVLEPLDPTPPAADVVLHAPVLPATSSAEEVSLLEYSPAPPFRP
jgi:hypothetical protein